MRGEQGLVRERATTIRSTDEVLKEPGPRVGTHFEDLRQCWLTVSVAVSVDPPDVPVIVIVKLPTKARYRWGGGGTRPS